MVTKGDELSAGAEDDELIGDGLAATVTPGTGRRSKIAPERPEPTALSHKGRLLSRNRSQ
jgi:hypothetical protein